MPDVKVLMPWEVPGGNQKEQPQAQDVMMPWEVDQQQPQAGQPQIPEWAKRQPQGVTHEAPEETPWYKVGMDSLVDIFTGESKETDVSRGLPEITEFRPSDSGYTMKGREDTESATLEDLEYAIGMTMSSTEEGQRQVVEEYFPGSRIWVDQKGNTIINLPPNEQFPEGTQAVLNKPGMSKADIAAAATEIALFYGPGKVTSFAKAGNFAKKLGQGAKFFDKIGKTWQRRRGTEFLLGAGTEAARQEVGKQFQKEAQETDLGLVLQAGIGEAVGGTFGDVLDARAVKKLEQQTGLPAQLGPKSRQALEETIGVEAETGMKFSRAGSTMAPSAADEAYILARGEGSRGAIEEHLQNLSKQREEYQSRFLDKLAPDEKASSAYRNLQKALADEKASRITARDELASELYGEARAFEGDIDTTRTVKFIDDQLKNAKTGSSIAKELKKARRLIAPEEGVNQSTEAMHLAKYDLDSLIEKASPTEKRYLMQVKKQFLDEFDSQNPAYGIARQTFAQQSKPIQYLSEEVFGDVEKVAPQHMKRLRKIVFDAEELSVNPEASRKLITELDKINPDLKNELLRQEMTSRLASVRGQGEEIPASKMLSSLYGSKAERNMFKSMMNPEQQKMYDTFEKALIRERFEYNSMLGGSQTSGREAAKGRIYKKGFGETMENLISSPTKSFAGRVANFWNGVSKADRERYLEEIFVESFLDPKNAKTLDLLNKDALTGKDVSKRFATFLTDVAKTSPQLAKYDTDKKSKERKQ